MRSRSSAKSSEAKSIEEISEYISQITEIAGKSACSKIGIYTGETKLIILGPFLRIRQNGIRFIGLFETGFCLLIAGVQVRMVLFGCFPICFFYIIVRGSLFQAQDLIIIPFICHVPSLTFREAGLFAPPAFTY